MPIKRQLNSIQRKYDAAIEIEKSIKKEMRSLERQGLMQGAISFKDGKYMRVVTSGNCNEERQFNYIGADKEKQQLAREAIARRQRHEVLQLSLSEIRNFQHQIESMLDDINMDANINHGHRIPRCSTVGRDQSGTPITFQIEKFS
tara:strand:- start:879 stop:1316 length:438 start_codon:yes stop_codon:yes gene_type:complete